MATRKPLSVVPHEDKPTDELDQALGLVETEDGFEPTALEALRAHLMPGGLWQELTQQYASQSELARVKRWNANHTKDKSRQAELLKQADEIEEKTLPDLRRQLYHLVDRIAELMAPEKDICESVDIWQRQLPKNLRPLLVKGLRDRQVDVSETLERVKALEASERNDLPS